MGKPGWLKFLDDIMPSGASRRYWVKHLDIEDLSSDEQDYVLLKFGTMSPIGNLRIKDSLPERYEVADNLYFSVDDVKIELVISSTTHNKEGQPQVVQLGLEVKRQN